VFEIKEKSKLKVSLYGEEFEISKPTYGQTLSLQEKLKGDGEKESMKIMKEFVMALGLPEKSVDDLILEDFLSLIEHVSGKKN